MYRLAVADQRCDDLQHSRDRSRADLLRDGFGQRDSQRRGSMTPDEFRGMLQATLEDYRLSKGERQALKDVIRDAALDDQMRGVLRHELFELARHEVPDPQSREILDWLEETNKLLLPPTGDGNEAFANAYFSPGEQCTQQILGLLNRTLKCADLCVFTITDDRICEAIRAAHRRGVALRIISDNDKALDLGSDIAQLRALGVPLRLDQTPDHMHHKFAVFDRALILTGSFNWTRSAADNNQENLVVSNDRRLVQAFLREFERLWERL